jgi:hypothetical protein
MYAGVGKGIWGIRGDEGDVRDDGDGIEILP